MRSSVRVVYGEGLSQGARAYLLVFATEVMRLEEIVLCHDMIIKIVRGWIEIQDFGEL